MQPQTYRFLDALQRKPVDKTPIWIMRQAGRYLPEYRQVRAQAKTFLNLCKNPELACEVTLQPLARFDLDAAIIFSDILTIPDAMGLGLEFVEQEGPIFRKPVRSLSDIQQLYIPDMHTQLGYVMEAISVTKKALSGRVPLIGFSGSPWTLATYMVEGGPSKNFHIIKKMLFSQPDYLEKLLTLLSDAVVEYLKAQVEAGADALMIFDTWGGVLSLQNYQTFSLLPMTKIVTAIRNTYPNIPIILFTKGGGQWLEKMAESGCHALGIDWMTDLSAARARVGHKVALQGNMDPSTLYASPDRIAQEVERILKDYGGGPGHIFNLGHGIHPDTPIESVSALVEAVRQWG